MTRAVVFDLWQTLAAWPEERSATLRRDWSASLGVEAELLGELWYESELYRLRETGPIRPAVRRLYELLGVDRSVEEILELRRALTLESLVPVDGALATVDELRRRGVRVGLVSNCTEEVALVWEETPFAGCFDVAVFSATAGCMKPERRIYELALEGLGVAAQEALFVGDGANDELEGARRVGMTPVLVHPEGQGPHWPELTGWEGLRVTSISQVLALVT